MPAHLLPGECGLALAPVEELGDVVVGAWDDFLTVATSADLELPSRLPGWTGRDTCVHLGSWGDHPAMSRVLAAARAGGGKAPPHPDVTNAMLVESHRRASTAEILASLERSRDALAAWFESPEAAELGRAQVRSAVGELPLASLLHAGAYELAVHALDLAPCGGSPPSGFLLDRGLAALMDVTGALAARRAIALTVTAQTPSGGWSFTSTAEGWTTQPVAAGAPVGAGLSGSHQDLLDASAGRHSIPHLLLARRLKVHQLPALMSLAPIVAEVPGLPGGAALQAGISGLSAGMSGLGKLLGRLRP